MLTTIRRRAMGALAFLFVSVTLFASTPWDGAPFSADPKALIAAASEIKPKEGGVVVLLAETRVLLDAKGLATRRERRVFRIVDESGVEAWSSVEAVWSPWYDEKPKVEARVVSADGTVHPLDPKSFEKSDADDEPDMFTDTRVISGPLPAIAPGAVVEELITYRQKNTLYEAGTAFRHDFFHWVETKQARFSIEYPSSIPFQVVNRTKPEIKPQRSETNGVTRLVFETGELAKSELPEAGIPADASEESYVAFSTGKSWQDVAARYAEIVDKQLTPSDVVTKTTAGAIAATKDPHEIASRLLEKVEQGIRYAGVEFGEGSIVPRTPAETLAHKYGDCKDKATLLVAMLRQAGVPAQVALLNAGEEADVDAELPGLGRFNHVIVYVPGEKPLWIDPTDEFARAGELPDQDQGRLALVASPQTAALLKTPVADGASNRSVETRDFTLPEDGKSNPVETTEYFGREERSVRRYYAMVDAKMLKERLETYVKEAYLAEALGKYSTSDPHDLTKPFRITIEALRAKRGVTVDSASAVAFFDSTLVANMPSELKASDDEDDEKTAKRKPRKHDYELAQPFVCEVKHRVQPPPGYVIRSSPKDETTTLGTASLTKSYTLQPDGVLLADYRFDSGPRRMTPAQFEATREAIAKVVNEPASFLLWDQHAKKLLDSDDVGKAIAEMRQLAQQHPREALHHIEIAQALLHAGFGTAAQAEAKVAIGIEPRSAKAHRAHARTLTYDTLGRQYGKGFDPDGAVREYRKAKELDPKDVDTRWELAFVLARNADGVAYGRGARLDEAIAECVALKAPDAKLDVNAEVVDRELMVLYLRSGRFKELKDLAAKTKDTQKKDVMSLVATAMLDGSPAAVAEAEKFDATKKRELLTKAAGVLVIVRHYPEAADLVTAAAAGAPNAAELREQADLFRKMKRAEDMPIKDDPEGLFQRFVAAVFSDPENAAKEFVSEDVLDVLDTAEDRRMMRAIKSKVAAIGPFAGDATIAAMELQQDGSEEIGYRVVARSSGVPGAVTQLTMFVIRENGKYRLAGNNQETASLGLRALRLAEAGKFDAARQWLDWAREYVHGSDGDDPAASAPFATLWTRGKAAGETMVRVAAASLLHGTKKAVALAIPVLESSRDKVPAELQWRVDVALLQAYADAERWDKVVEASDRVLAKTPSALAFLSNVRGLVKTGRADEARKRAQTRLAQLKDDPAALQALGTIAVEARDYAAALDAFGKAVASPDATANDFNEHAWLALFVPGNLDKAIEEARRATSLQPASYAYLNTLATLYAEQGKSAEARQMLLKSLDAFGSAEVRDADWYVVGRIAENYGILDIARDTYGKLTKPQDDRTTSWALAQGRLTKMK